MKATAVLITKEKEYPLEVLESLKDFDEILIDTQCPNIYRRYELIAKAKNDIIYIQDDDCIINTWELFKNYNGQLTNALTQHHFNWYKGQKITLIGFGCFFPKSMLDFKKYTDKFPMDRLSLSQADRIFTYLNQPHNSIVMDIKNLPTATDNTRMSSQPNHWSNLQLIKERLCAL